MAVADRPLGSPFPGASGLGLSAQAAGPVTWHVETTPHASTDRPLTRHRPPCDLIAALNSGRFRRPATSSPPASEPTPSPQAKTHDRGLDDAPDTERPWSTPGTAAGPARPAPRHASPPGEPRTRDEPRVSYEAVRT